MNLKDRVSKARLDRAQEIAHQVREGIYIQPAFDIMQSWYPERPSIKKDPNALSFIFEENDQLNSNSVPG